MDRTVLDPTQGAALDSASETSPTVNRLLAELALFASVGAFLVVLSIAGWSVRLLGLDEQMTQERSLITEIARVELQLDSVLTLGDLVFYSHRQDFLVPAMATHIEQLGASIRHVNTQSTDLLPDDLDLWNDLVTNNRQLSTIVSARASAATDAEREELTGRYDTAAAKMVASLLEASEAVHAWDTQLKTQRAEAQRTRLLLNLMLLTAYLSGVIVLWRRTIKMIAVPLNRLQQSAEQALSGKSRYTHQKTGASEVIDLSGQMELLIHHLEGQVEQRTESLSVQTRRLEAEIHERIIKDKALRDRNQELQHAMNRLAVMQDALLKKAQLEALGQVAGGVAHDFNNVLTPIIGTSEMLATSLDTMSPEEVLESINLIQMAATDAATLTRRLRSSFVSDEEVEFSIVDLATIAASAVQMSRTEWGRRSMEENTPTFKIVEDLEPDVVAWGNHGRLRQALVNLIVNAIHASPLGGTIRVAVRQTDNGPRLSVQDFGTGMTPEVLENCLKPLYTTKGSEGTGLGLMNVSATAREHEGRLEIESEVGSGTTITLHLPPPDATDT